MNMKKVKIEYCITLSDEKCYEKSDEELKEIALYEVWNYTNEYDKITIEEVE